MVTSEMEELLATARRDHQGENGDAAYHGYASAAGLARSEARPMELAHALRHISDLARERGPIEEAVAAAAEAVAIYPRQVEPQLNTKAHYRSRHNQMLAHEANWNIRSAAKTVVQEVIGPAFI